MALMKTQASLMALVMLSLLGVACSSTEKSRMANKHRMAYQRPQPVQAEPGLEAVAEAPRSEAPRAAYSSWGGNMTPF